MPEAGSGSGGCEAAPPPASPDAAAGSAEGTVPGRRFARTAAAARQIIEQDEGAGSWHLTTVEREEPSFWKRILHRPNAGARRVSFGLGRRSRAHESGHDETRPLRLAAPASQRTTGSVTARATGTDAGGADEDPVRRYPALPPPAVDRSANRDLPSSPWSPQASASVPTGRGPREHEAWLASSGADGAPRPCFGLVPVPGGGLPSEPRTHARHRPPLHLGMAPAPAGAAAARWSLSDAVRQTTDQVGRAVVVWARRRSPTWFAYLPVLAPAGPFGKQPHDGTPSRRWRLAAAASAGVVTGAFIGLYNDDLADRAGKLWAALALPSGASDKERAQAPARSADAAQQSAPLPERAAVAARSGATASGATRPAADPRPAAPAAPHDNEAAKVALDSDSAAVEWQHLYRLGHEFQSKGDLEAASEMFRLAARLNPTHGALLYDWGYLLQTRGNDQAAIEKYRAAVRLEPTHPYAHYNLGYLLQRQGDNEAALTHYEEASKNLPRNPYLQYDWGVVLERLGRVEEAVQRYRRAAELAPEAQPGRDAQRRLAALDLDR